MRKQARSLAPRSLSTFLLAALALSLLAGPLPAAAGGGEVRRFALSAGANDGGAQRARLRYAGSDAASMGRLLKELGGVRPMDNHLLLDPDRAALQQGLEALRRRVEQARARGERVEVFFYYSGHSDEEGLLLGEERFGYRELRRALDRIPADVRVAILDSCASGAFTRQKGGVIRPAFLVDTSSQVKGHAFLTASSADEVAQESDRIGASFFTHHLISGLRGAADSSGSGKVTLTDAYRYAYQETLSHTERSLAGAQHPNYEIQLVGTGDLVITDLRSTSAGLLLDERIAGRIYVRDASGALVVEVRKQEALPMELGLAPGEYVVTVAQGESLSEARLVLVSERKVLLAPSQLVPVAGEAYTARGGGEEELVDVPFEVALLPSLTTKQGARTRDNFSLYLLAARGTRLDGLQLGLGAGIVDERMDGAQIGLGANLAGGPVEGSQITLGANRGDASVSGSQISLGFNHAGAWMEGAQITLGANYAGEWVEGAQIALGYNHAETEMKGSQIALGVNQAGVSRGAQIAGAVNVAGPGSGGAQIAAGVNVAREDFDGLQAAGGVNWTAGRNGGAQVAGGLNQAAIADGAQIGPVNTAGTVGGAQIGLINVGGRVDGAQIGLLNFAKESDASIGLLSFVGNGRYAFSLWSSDVNTGNLSLKLGSRRVYSILTAGISPKGDRPAAPWTFGAGLGVHFPVEASWLSYLDVDVTAQSIHHGTRPWTGKGPNMLQSLRIGGGWRLAGNLALVAGPVLNVSEQWDTEQKAVSFLPAASMDAGKVTVRIWPGFFAGIEI